MRNWKNTNTKCQSVAVMLFPGFSNLCLASVVEPLRAANELARCPLYSWSLVSMFGDTVTSSSGLPVLSEGRLSDHAGGDFLFLVPSGEVESFATDWMGRVLRSVRYRYKTMAGMDTGSWLLAAAGLLDGRKATIHPDLLTEFAETFSDVDVSVDRYIDGSSLMTCGGAMSAFDLVLEQIGQTHGEALKLEVAAYLMASSSPSPKLLGLSSSCGDSVDQAVSIMSANIEAPLKINQIANRLGTHQRTLSNKFRQRFGASPQTVYRRLRLSAARRFVEQSRLSVAEIAVRSGYTNPAAMTRAFVEEFGASPTTMRKEARG